MQGELTGENAASGPPDTHLANLIRTQCRILAPPMIPELSFWGADSASPLWNATQETLDGLGLAAPFWAFAWPGGQALARHVLDNPDWVAGRRVAVLASGAALEAIAAAKRGAAGVAAIDIDPAARVAAALNADLNAVRIRTEQGDAFVPGPAAPWRDRADILLIGDAFYEAGLSAAVSAALAPALRQGIDILVGDPGRGYPPALPPGFEGVPVAEYAVPTPVDLEGAPLRPARVLRLS